MEKYIVKNELSYTLVGDYYLPNLILPEDKYHIGKYGLMRQHYLKNHRKGYYITLLTSGELNEHLHEIDEISFNRMELLSKQMAEHEGVTEHLKAENQMLWVGKMNNIQNRIEEMIREELIYI